MTRVGYRYLGAGRHPGSERRLAEDIEFLRSLGIRVLPPDNRSGS